MKHISILLIASVVAGPAAAWGECEFTAERRVEIDAAALARLELRTGAGDLEIRGEPGLKRIEAIGRACASTQEMLDQSQLVRTGSGDGTVLATELPDPGAGGWFDNSYASIDVSVRVPAAIALKIADSSGDAKVENVAAVDATDSSGDLKLRDIAGAVRVDDSSGDVIVTNAGSVQIDHDSSGDLEIANVTGDVVIDNDSSGDIEIRDVRGSALVRSDSSGGISFTKIGRDAEVGSDTSGEIDADDIGGNFIVRSDGSGSISHDRVVGRVEVPDED